MGHDESYRYVTNTWCDECDCDIRATYGWAALLDAFGRCPICGHHLTTQTFVTPEDNLNRLLDDLWDGEIEL